MILQYKPIAANAEPKALGLVTHKIGKTSTHQTRRYL